MKLVLSTLGVLFLLISVQANAQLNPSSDPFTLCNSMTFDSDKQKCVAEIRMGDYYDREALAICSRMSFGSDKLKCISKIRDKAYFSGELSVCKNMSFASDQLKCLENSGDSHQGGALCPTIPVLKQKLKRAMNDFERGNYRKGIRIVTDVYYELEYCDQ